MTIIVLALVLTFWFFIRKDTGVQKTEEKQASLFFEDTEISTSSNENLEVNVGVSTGNADVKEVKLTVLYNPRDIEVVDILPHQNNLFQDSYTVTEKNINKEKGQVYFGLASGKGVSGRTPFATLHVKVKPNGSQSSPMIIFYDSTNDRSSQVLTASATNALSNTQDLLLKITR